MPFIEPDSGDVEHGVGGGNASINNSAFSPGGAAGWRDRNLATFANGADGWIVSTYDKRSGAIARVDFGGGVVTPANTAYAGGGHVAAWLGSRGDDRGLYSTIGLRLPDAGLLGVGPGGELAYKPAYQSNGPSVVREVSGEEWTLTPGHAGALQLLGNRRAIWMEGFAVRVAALPTPAVYGAGGIWKAQAAFAGGQWWICYYSSDKGIVLHPFASAARAFPILPVGDGWHAIAAVGANTIRIAIARTEAEGAGDIWGYDVDVLTGAATPLPFWPGGTPRVFPFAPMEEINPPALVFPTFRFTHPISVYPYKAEGSGLPDLFTLGTYTETKTPPPPLPSPLPKGRLLLAHDGENDWTIPAGALRSYDLVLWELYRVTSETLEQSAARWERQARAYLLQWPRDCGLVPMFYNQFNPATGAWLWTDAEVLAGLEYLDVIANLDARIKVIAPFSYDRANGIKPNPNLTRALEDLKSAAAAAGAATLTPIPSDPPIDPPHPKPDPPFRALVALKGVSSMKGFIKIHTDAPHYTGVNPTAGHGAGDARFPVYYARPGEPDAGGAWETVEFTKQGNAFAARYVEADRQLSIQNDGKLETRDAGAIGPFELFQIRTEEGSGRNVLYRDDLVGVVLEVELLK